MKTKKNRQYRSNQGRSPHQMRSNYIAVAISGLGLLTVIIFIIISKYI